MSSAAAGDGGVGGARAGSYDPWAGDPGEYEGIAARLTDRETQSNQVRAGVLGLINDPALAQWLGDSADAFRRTLEPLPMLLGQMVYAYGSSAQALRKYAQEMRDGKAGWSRTLTVLRAAADSPDVGGPGAVRGVPDEKNPVLARQARDAQANRDRAMKACAAVISEAEADLGRVRKALGDPRYADFNATFQGLGGQLPDLAGLGHMGDDVAPGTAVDPGKILDTITFLNQAGSEQALERVRGLSPAEVDALMAMMTPEQRQKLNVTIQGSDNRARVEWANLLLKDVDRSTLGAVQGDLPALLPDWHGTDAKNVHWAQSDNALFGPNGVDVEQDIHQGATGDCWFMSATAAIAERDPEFFQSRIVENANGTYTVTFYDDGVPTQVTVDGQLPVDSSNQAVFAGAKPFKWAAIYEKAYAQYNGGYSEIAGGWGDQGLHDLTGQHTDRLTPDDHSLKDVAQWIRDGRAVTTGTRSNSFLFWGGGTYLDGARIVSAHEYSVESVDMGAHPPTITLLNPWGADQVHDGKSVGRITLTEAQWHEYFREIGITKVRP